MLVTVPEVRARGSRADARQGRSRQDIVVPITEVMTALGYGLRLAAIPCRDTVDSMRDFKRASWGASGPCPEELTCAGLMASERWRVTAYSRQTVWHVARFCR